MAITFPAAPTNGQIYTDTTSGQSWTWDGTKWKGANPDQLHWKRTGTTLSPTAAGDTIQGNLVPTNGGFGTRNRIINGDMRIDQRNAGASVSTPPSYTLDRWKVRYESKGGVAGTCTVQRSTTAPAGFTNSLLLTVGTAKTVVSGDRFGIEQPIEGLNMSDFGWGTATAQSVTLSFWVRSSITGAFGICFSNFSRGYAATYTIGAVNTWEHKTVTITGDTGGTWATDTSTGTLVVFDIGMGSDARESTGSWQTGTYLGATGGSNLVATNGATFYITGVQLEPGTVATPFERRSYGQELSLCQRYYEELYIFSGAGTTYIRENVLFKQTKRAVPTGYVYAQTPGGAGTNTVNAIYQSSSERTAVISNTSVSSARLDLNTAAFTANQDVTGRVVIISEL